ncbi:hypothetical protein DICVIV_03771 [Dictyocaulus viviparus]|uniref:Pyridine nucleotide-disulfide oxidoreductase domain-containing protein 2 n=1 Tax=Dictyocaulus viviparus TaxID=29172 RepID=A0A0D8XZZ7_DICVI|nr:hypothetical protein DICVIV_03771 [Dictyocaulus viviparus]
MQAAYMARAGKRVCVLERRELLGGFKFSRASYLLSLLRPIVIEDLKLKEHGLRYHIRNPSSFTPIRDSKQKLLLGLDMNDNCKEIAKFSRRDAQVFPKYEDFIGLTARSLEPLMDDVPFNAHEKKWKMLMNRWRQRKVYQSGKAKNLSPDNTRLSYPVAVMNKWFESEVLKATLATDGIIGFAASPYDMGTGYVLLHHLMGGLDNRRGAWGYVIGGMGEVSKAIASSARSHGAEIFTEQEVVTILTDCGHVKGVRLTSGREVYANTVLSNATPTVTFENLVSKVEMSHLDSRSLPEEFAEHHKV